MQSTNMPHPELAHVARLSKDATPPMQPSSLLGAILRRRHRMRQVMRRVDERHMREGLREIGDEALGLGIILLGELADIVAKRDEPLEEMPRLVEAALQDVVVREPEARPTAAIAPV